MSVSLIALRVAARFQMRQADQPPGARQHARNLTKPINTPKGISREVVKENGEFMLPGVKPNPRDIQPKDVFNLTPNNGGVLSLVQTGKDLQNAIEKSVPKDKGYGDVYNLSQYLIREKSK